MLDDTDPALEAMIALQADGVHVTAIGEELDLWRVGDFTYTDADLCRLAVSRGLIHDDA